MKAKEELTIGELYELKAEYERMLAIARERNQWNQEFRLQEFIEKINSIIEQKVGVSRW